MNLTPSAPETQTEVLIVDLQGNLRSKWVPASDTDKVLAGAVRLPLSTQVQDIWGDDVDDITKMSLSAGDPDGLCVPSSSDLRPVPWNPGHSQVLTSMHELDGSGSFADPRLLLKQASEKLAGKGVHAVAAVELEFYLLDASSRSSHIPNPPSSMMHGGDVREFQVYDPRAMDRVESVLQRIHQYSHALDVNTTTTLSEIGPGQFEINLLHRGDVLAAADDATLLKRAVDRAASDEGMLATFMAKPYSEHTGSGMHVHVSIVGDDGSSYFDATESEANLLSATASLLNRLPDMLAVLAPHANSYRRLQPEAFAPVRMNWGYDHRGVAVRIPETHGPAARVEHRVAGSDANPYFVLTMILEALLESMGRDGVPDTDPVLAGGNVNGELLRSHWLDAIDDFRQSEFSKNCFGDRLHFIFTEIKQHEAIAINRQVTDVELKTYLSRL